MCRIEPTEVVPNLYVGTTESVHSLLGKVDVIVTLSSLDDVLWYAGYSGEIIYIPCRASSGLPQNVLQKYVARIAGFLEVSDGAVLVTSTFGYGRAAYFAAAVVAEMRPEIEDIVDWIRTAYGTHALSAFEQIHSLRMFTGEVEERSCIYCGATENLLTGRNMCLDCWREKYSSQWVRTTPTALLCPVCRENVDALTDVGVCKKCAESVTYNFDLPIAEEKGEE